MAGIGLLNKNVLSIIGLVPEYVVRSSWPRYNPLSSCNACTNSWPNDIVLLFFGSVTFSLYASPYEPYLSCTILLKPTILLGYALGLSSTKFS